MKNETLNPTEIIQYELIEQLDILKKSGEKNTEKFLDLARAASKFNINFTRAFNANKKVVESREVKTNRDVIRYVWDFENMTFN